MSQNVQYITDEAGARVGVLLDIETYRQLASARQEGDSSHDSELLKNLSHAELVALAETKLAPEKQSVLDDLLARNVEGQLSDTEQTQLDQLLVRVDNLNILKARAKYTLRSVSGSAS